MQPIRKARATRPAGGCSGRGGGVEGEAERCSVASVVSFSPPPTSCASPDAPTRRRSIWRGQGGGSCAGRGQRGRGAPAAPRRRPRGASPGTAQGRGPGRRRDRPRGVSLAQGVAATRAALERGGEVVFQGALAGGTWGGWSDFLERVERPSALGARSYAVADTKLKRKPHPKHVLQLALYSDLLAAVQGVAPELAHVELGDATSAAPASPSPRFDPRPRAGGDRRQRPW